MGKRSLTAFLLISIILLSIPGVAIGNESHVRSVGGQEYLNPLIDTLDRTKNDVEDSLDEALKLNYDLKEENGNISLDQNPVHLNRSEEIAVELEKELSKIDEVLWEIDGDVESSKHLKEYFLPFYRISSNLTRYTRDHENLTSNLTLMARTLNDGDVTIRGDTDLGQAFNNVYFYLKEMRDLLGSMEKNLESVDQTLFDLNSLKEIIQDNYALLQDYEEDLEMIDKYLDREPALTIYGPSNGYPGSEIFLKGVFNEKGAVTGNIEILIFKENETLAESSVTEKGFFEQSYNISWDQELGSLNFSAKVKSEDIWSGNLTIDLVKYPSEILLRTEKKAYYDEIVYIEGEFRTEAEVDLSSIELNISRQGSFEINHDGTFRFGLDSKGFRWGLTETAVNFTGNETISPSSENIAFEVNVPTEIVFFQDSKTLKGSEPSEMNIEGKLVNTSSSEGIEDQTLIVYLNGNHVKNITTHSGGRFRFTLPEDIQLEEGQHTLNARFEGPAKFRNATSEDIQIRVEGPDKFLQNPILMIIGAVGIGIMVLGYYLFESRKNGEGEGRESAGQREVAKTSPTFSVSRANSSDEITTAYREFLETLESSRVIEVKPSKTHRELESEIKSRPNFETLSQEVKYVTDLFEKALFTEKSLDKSEIEKFNSFLSTLVKEGLS